MTAPALLLIPLTLACAGSALFGFYLGVANAPREKWVATVTVVNRDGSGGRWNVYTGEPKTNLPTANGTSVWLESEILPKETSR